MKKYFFGANWKMNMSSAEADAFFKEWNQFPVDSGSLTVFFPTQYLLYYLQARYGNTILFGAQSVSQFSKGAFTGETASEFLAMDHISYALVGHSERRTLMNETDEQISEIMKKNQQNHITSILCVGESLEIREDNTYTNFIQQQLSTALQGILLEQPLIIAYEPLWAIGTGKTPTMQEIEDIHVMIHGHLETLGFKSSELTLIYGGSVNNSNAQKILSLPHVQGVLVGGASLAPKEFYEITNVSAMRGDN